jgi:hypothetical protein
MSEYKAPFPYPGGKSTIAAAVTAPLPTKCSTPGCKFPVVAVSAHDGKPVCRHCQEVIG